MMMLIEIGSLVVFSSPTPPTRHVCVRSPSHANVSVPVGSAACVGATPRTISSSSKASRNILISPPAEGYLRDGAEHAVVSGGQRARQALVWRDSGATGASG